MNLPILNDNSTVVTMSSIELVDFINRERRHEANAQRTSDACFDPVTLRHSDFMTKLEKHPGIDSPKFSGQYKDSTGRTLKCYRLPKRECELMVMSESLLVQARLYDRLAKLEAKQAAPAALSTMDILQLAIESERGRLAAVEQLAIAAPKVAFVDSYVDSTGLKGFRQVAKLLKANEARLREFLADKKIMYRLGGDWAAYQSHIDAGRFDVKAGENSVNKHAFTSTLFTSKGIEWLAGLWAVHGLNGGAA